MMQKAHAKIVNFKLGFNEVDKIQILSASFSEFVKKNCQVGYVPENFLTFPFAENCFGCGLEDVES